jgi:hypothetical protein
MLVIDIMLVLLWFLIGRLPARLYVVRQIFYVFLALTATLSHTTIGR